MHQVTQASQSIQHGSPNNNSIDDSFIHSLPLSLSLSYVHDPRTSLFPFRYRGGLTIARGDGRGSLSLSPILVTIIRAIVLVIIIALVIIEDPRCRPCYQRERGAAVTPVIGLSLPRYSSPYSNANSNVICRYTAYVIDRFTNRS